MKPIDLQTLTSILVEAREDDKARGEMKQLARIAQKRTSRGGGEKEIARRSSV